MTNCHSKKTDLKKLQTLFEFVEIIELVKKGAPQYGVPFRPIVMDQTFDDLNNIMNKCWKEDPNERPDFSILKSTIRKVNK